MNKKTKIIGLALFFGVGGLLINGWSNSGLSSVQANQLAVDNVNGGNTEFVAAHSFMYIQQYALAIWCLLALLGSWLTLKGDTKLDLTNKATVMLVCILPFFASCKPYQTPVYKEISNNETAFVIPLEGDTKAQAKFDSKAFLEKHKVGTKRIEIPTRWNQEGRGNGNGSYIPTVTVIVVDRSPVTRNWEASTKGTDKAIWVESSDSVGFSMGFNCTAFIKEEDTSAFLYWYSSGSLSNVMDNEIRGRVQQIAAEESAKFPLDELRSRKNEVAASVRNDIIPFFAERGITITTVGMFGGMTYENPNIQNSIDNVFVSQQEKNVALAKLETQKKENERVILEAEGIAKQRQIQSEAEAKAIMALTQAVANGGSNYLQLKSLEVQLKQTEKWNGQLPTVTSGVSPLIDAGRFLNK
jgi:regulator of protease activity HflC (stomatin/prohibitin superfamily)